MQSFRTALQCNPEYAKVHVSIGLEYARVGRDSEAVEAIRNGLRLRPALPKALIALGSIHARHRRFDEAVECFGKAAGYAPDDDGIHVRILRTHLAAGRRDAALAEFKYLEDRKSPLAEQVIGEIYPS